jgi:hypothetical protein
MVIISHRANLHGPNKATENQPKQIADVLSLTDFHVETDVCLIHGQWFLGHDDGEYPIEKTFLFEHKLWLHCKNLSSISELISNSIYKDCNFFWHQDDDFSITSKSYVWHHPLKSPIFCPRSIYMMLGEPTECEVAELLEYPPLGICTDYPILLSELVADLT